MTAINIQNIIKTAHTIPLIYGASALAMAAIALIPALFHGFQVAFAEGLVYAPAAVFAMHLIATIQSAYYIRKLKDGRENEMLILRDELHETIRAALTTSVVLLIIFCYIPLGMIGTSLLAGAGADSFISTERFVECVITAALSTFVAFGADKMAKIVIKYGASRPW